MTEREKMVEWLWARYPDQPLRVALMTRILSNREIRK